MHKMVIDQEINAGRLGQELRAAFPGLTAEREMRRDEPGGSSMETRRVALYSLAQHPLTPDKWILSWPEEAASEEEIQTVLAAHSPHRQQEVRVKQRALRMRTAELGGKTVFEMDQDELLALIQALAFAIDAIDADGRVRPPGEWM